MAPLADDEEMTELFDADFPRVDLVGKGANGIPRFLVMKDAAGDASGLLEPDFVRSLIGKQADEPSGRERAVLPSGVTLSGSPADIAAFIHKAAVRAAEPDDVAKAKNDTADRKHKAATGAAMENGSYPIANEADLTKAIHAVGRGGSSHNAIRAHIISRARSLGASSKIPDNWNSDGSLKGDSVSKTGTVAKADMGPELDDGVDGLDPTVPLAAPDEDAPGDPTDPGSPAWEAIDAATACKWTSILARARVAVDLLAEREMLEAASADPSDMENAYDLQDVCCAIDYAIGVLAPFAVAEQSEADCGEADMMAAVGKSAADLEAVTAVCKAMGAADLADPLAKIEGLAWVRKAGRVLSSVNEAHIREAAGRLNTVLQSLPQAPTADDGQPVAKEKETTVAEETQDAQVAKDGMPASPEAQAKNTDPVNAGGTTGMGQPRVTGPDAALPGDGPQATLPGDAQTPGRQVIKADGEGKTPMMVVYNQAGKLVGIVDPTDITPVANAEADPEDDMDSSDGGDADGDGTAAAAPADASTDMTPQPPAAAGTPADAVADDNTVAKSGEFTALASATNHLMSPDALESIIAKAVAAALGAQAPAEDIAKQADVAGLSEQVETLKARLAQVEEQPAAPKVFTNGQLPPQHQMRGQNEGTAPGQVDVAKALDLKHEMYTADPARAKAIHDDMSQMARDQLAAIHRR